MKIVKWLMGVLVVMVVVASSLMWVALSHISSATKDIWNASQLRYDLFKLYAFLGVYGENPSEETKKEFLDLFEDFRARVEEIARRYPDQSPVIEKGMSPLFSIVSALKKGLAVSSEEVDGARKAIEDVLQPAMKKVCVKSLTSATSSLHALNFLPVAFVVFTPVILGYVFWIARKTERDIEKFRRIVEDYRKGNMTVELDSAKMVGEVKPMFEAFKGLFSDVLLPLLRNVRDDSRELLEISADVFENASSLNEAVDTFSESFSEIEEKSAHMKDFVDSSMTSVEEILRGTENVAEMATDLSELASTLSEHADNGKSSLSEMWRSVEGVVKRTENAKVRVERLVQLTARINEIVEVVTSIAEQTNLLALNAAIEAARAGEAGKGFAVVADEIRKLADESRKAAEEISSVLSKVNEGIKVTGDEMEEVVKAVRNSEKGVEEMGAVFEKLIDMSKVVLDRSENLAAVSEEQTASAQTASESLTELKESFKEFFDRIGIMAKETYKLSEMGDELEGISKKLRDMAENMRKKVDYLKL